MSDKKYKIGDKVILKLYSGQTCEVTIIEIDTHAEKPYKIEYKWGETAWVNL